MKYFGCFLLPRGRKRRWTYADVNCPGVHVKARTVEPGDLILTYVKGRGFADIRRVVKKGLVALRGRVPYTDGVFPHAIETKAVRVLPFDDHVPAEGLASKLKICSDGSHWKHAFRQSIRRIDGSDGTLIASQLQGN
jgi:hypothetical protein